MEFHHLRQVNGSIGSSTPRTRITRNIDTVEVVSVERRQGGGGCRSRTSCPQEAADLTIGFPGRTFDRGIQRYRIISTTENVDRAQDGPEGARSQWYWDVVGSGWSIPMRRVEVRASVDRHCEAAVPCEITQADGGTRISVSQLPAFDHHAGVFRAVCLAPGASEPDRPCCCSQRWVSWHCRCYSR